ncbi:MAG: sigmaY antisigma factor component [Bacillota bacterium]|nr:sigmaY antisigma factor component [Bacillota bacterium]MDI7250096.1 sigmaY antisigma factor component [Bacillota bacterium]
MNSQFTMPVWAWVLLGVLLMAQGWWIFRDAKRRGYNPWLWGAFGLLNVPSSLIIYLLVRNYREKGKERIGGDGC